MVSVWSDSINNDMTKNIKTLTGDAKTNVLIIGGGISGILCAHMLHKRGIDYMLVEASRIFSGVTKNTTAKITAQHALIYDKIISNNGIEYAKLFYEVNMLALSEYKKLAVNIDCDFEEKTAYVYSMDDRNKLELEANAYSKIGIPYTFKETSPLPLKTAGFLGMEHQAQFNPLKFLKELANDLNIYENTFIKNIEGNTAYTDKFNIKAKYIIMATHFPVVNIPGLYFMKMYQHRSYVLALENGPDVDGMYIDEKETGHSFRNYKDYLLVGGGDHRTGKPGGGYHDLKKTVKSAFPDLEIKFAWATQDCMTLDGIPYIGIHRASAPNILVATGYNKWGMTSSMLSAIILTDLITEGKSQYESVFSPQRTTYKPQLFLNALSSLDGLISIGKRCPHMGCALKWNDEEKSWDCPCHGSRFDKYGNLIDNPAKRSISIE